MSTHRHTRFRSCISEQKNVIVGREQISNSSEPFCLPIQKQSSLNVLLIKSLGLLSVIFFSRWKGVTASVEVSKFHCTAQIQQCHPDTTHVKTRKCDRF